MADFCTVIVDVRFLPGMSSTSVREDIEKVLDELKRDDPDFEYEIEMPPAPKYRVNTVVMEPFDLPRDEYILDTVLRQYRTVAGREPDGVGTVLPGSYTGTIPVTCGRPGSPAFFTGPAAAANRTPLPTNTPVLAICSRWRKSWP